MDLFPVSIDRVGALENADIAMRNDGPGDYTEGRVMYQIAVIDGTAHLYKNENSENEFITQYEWEYIEEVGPADDVSIDFDGYWEREADLRFRFYSVGEPWIFRVHNGDVIVKQLGSSEFTLASGAITKVSVARGWKNVGHHERDQGLIAAYLDNGYAKYRNRAEQEDHSVIWESEKDIVDEDSNPIQAVNIAAFRSIDYRSGFLYETAGGEIHALITPRNWSRMGIPPEVISASIIDYQLDLTGITHYVVGDGPFPTDDTRFIGDKWQWGEHDSETITASIDYTVGPLLWGVNTEPILLENFPITENGEENWGKRIRITFEHGITNNVGLEDYIHVKDEADNVYPVISTSGGEIYEDPLDPTKFDGTRELILEVFDFNDAAVAGDTMTVEYFSGENRLQGEAGQDLESFIETYTPTNLDPEGFPSPEVEAIYNE